MKVLAVIFVLVFLISTGLCEAEGVTIFQNWDNMTGWTTHIGSGTDPGTMISRTLDAASGGYYLDTTIYRSSADNGVSSIYASLGDAAVSAGTVAGSLPEMWIQYDVKGRYESVNAAYCVGLGLFNSAGDNDNSPNINFLGLINSGTTRTQGTSRIGENESLSSQLYPSSGVYAYRVKAHIYNSEGRTLMYTGMTVRVF